MRRWVRRGLVALAVLVLLLGVAVGTAWVLFRLYGPELIRARLQSEVTTTLGRPARVEAVAFSPWLTGLRVSGVTVASGVDWEEGALLQLDHADITIRLESLWRRRLVVAVTLTGLEVTSTARGGGSADLAVLSLPSTFGVGSVEIDLGMLRLVRGRVLYRDLAAGWVVEARGIEADARPQPEALVISARAESVRIESAVARERLERLRAEGIVRPGEIRIETARLWWEGHEVQLSGSLSQPATGLEMRATVRDEVPLETIASRAGLTWPLAGLARVEATIRGAVAAPRIEARIAVPELVAGPLRARDIRFGGSLADGTLRIPDLRGELFGGSAQGTLTVSPEATTTARRVELTLDGLRLPGALAPLGAGSLRAEARLADGGVVLGPTTAQWSAARLNVAGRAEPGQLALRAELDTDLATLAPATGQVRVAGRARVTAEATGTWDRPVVMGRVEAGPLTLATEPIERVALTYRLDGSAGLSRWTGWIEAGRVAAPDMPIDDLRAAFTLDAERVDVQRLTGRVRRIPVALRGTWSWADTGRAEADFGPIDLAALPEIRGGLAITGTGTARLEAEIQRGRVSATAVIGLDDVSLANVSLGTGRLVARLTGRDAAVELSFPATRLTATGNGRLEDGQTISVRARAERVDLDPIIRQLAPGARGHVRGTLSARAEAEIPVGRPETTQATVWIEPDDLVVAGAHWTSRSPTVVRWNRGRLAVDQLALSGPLGTLTASAAIDAGAGEGRIAVALEGARLPAPLDRVGSGAVQAEARLTRTALEDVSLRARWPAWSLTAAGRVPFEAPLALRGRLTTDLAEAGRDFGVARVAGQGVVSADIGGSWREPVATGRIEVPTLTVADVALTRVTVPFHLTRDAVRIDQASARLAGAPLAFAGSAWATDGGWRGQGMLTAQAVAVGGWPVEALRAAFAVDGERLLVTDLELRVRGIPARGGGSWVWGKGGRLEGHLGPGSLAGWAGLSPALDLAGVASGRVQATFASSDDVTATAALRLEGVRAAGISLGAGTVDLELRGHQGRAALAFPERRLTAVAEGRVEAGTVITVQAAVDDLSVAELVRRLGSGVAASVAGTLSARLLASVPVDRPVATHGTLRLDPLQIVVAGETLSSREPVVVMFEAGAWRVDRVVLQGKAGTISGNGRLEAGGALDAELRGRLPLALLRSLRPEVEEAGGSLDVAARVTGTTAAPVIEGEGTLRGGSLRIRGYAETVREIEARFTASPAGIRLAQARGVLGGGGVSASGEAALAAGEFGAYRVALEARRVAVTPIERLSTLWDGDLELTGRGTRGQLTGELRLLRGSYTGELAPPAAGPATTAGRPAEPGFALPLRVLVKLDDNLLVRNRTAHLRIGGTLSIEGTTARPAVLGALETREGIVTFRDRRFTVVTAAARFLDPRRMDPFLDGLATARIRDYDVTVRVSGRADSLEVRLRSTPPLSQEDLLALVAFGVTRAELERSPTGVLAEEAARTLIRDLLGFEGLGGAPGSTSPGESVTQRLQVGTVTTERTTLGQTGAIETSGSQRVRLEYQLLGPVSLTGEHGVSGGYAAGLVLRLRFR